jgi:squalene-associated FAD-dependent desaturase
MAAAVRLTRLGVRVLLLEQRGHLGGRAYSLTDDASGDTFDNGQHVFTGAYDATLQLLRELGTDDRISFQPELRLDLRDTDGPPASLRCPSLPAPLHLLMGLLRLPGLGIGDRVAALRMGAALRRAMRPDAATELDALSASEWLARNGQTHRLQRMLWAPLTMAIVNETPDRASAWPLARALAESFLGSRARSRMGIPSMGLSALFEPALKTLLEQNGGQLRTGARITGLEMAPYHDGERLAAVVAGETREEVDGAVLAVPHHAVAALLPAAWRQQPPFADLGSLGHAPIVSIHLWLDRETLAEPFVGLLGTAAQWVFNRRHLAGDVNGHALSVVYSAAHREAELSADALVEECLEELRRLIPPVRQAQLLGSRVVKERRATFSARPGTDALRPGPQTPIRSLVLAGDWTDTGLPATIEGAVRSGFRAAENVLLSCRD